MTFDWKNGTLTVRAGKSHRTGVLPLPCVTGQAIADYLHESRHTPFGPQRQCIYCNRASKACFVTQSRTCFSLSWRPKVASFRRSTRAATGEGAVSSTPVISTAGGPKLPQFGKVAVEDIPLTPSNLIGLRQMLQVLNRII